MTSRQAPITSFFGGEERKGGSGGDHKTIPKKAAAHQASWKRRGRRGSGFGQCPLCSRSFPLHNLQLHASKCVGGVSSRNNNADKQQARANKKESVHEDANYLQHHREPIPGLFVFENFISEEEEALILAELDGTNARTAASTTTTHETNSVASFLPWKPANFNGPHYGKRWGVHCNLRDRKVSAPENPLPCFVQSILMPRLKQVRAMTGITPNEANAIDYRRQLGHYLSDHVDDRKLSKEPIANLSLAGDCYMTFRNVAPQRNTAVDSARVWLPRRCLQVLTGRARYDFSHGIANSDLCCDRRVSVTMRESPLTVNVLQKLQSVASRPAALPRSLPMIQNPIEPTDEPIPGLFLFENFITMEEERKILEELDRPNVPWNLEKHSGLHREKRWGVEHDLWSRHVRPPKNELPHFMCEIILPKLKRVTAMKGCVPNEVNSIEYRRKEGHSLKDHADDRQKSKEPIANLSIAGDCYMTYRNEKQNTALVVRKVLLKRCCLQIMTGKARYDYTHGIQNQDLLSDRRVSVTMREIPF